MTRPAPARVLCTAAEWLCLLASTVSAEMFAISTAHYPYVYLTDPEAPAMWNRGEMALRQAGALAVRINSRGVQYLPASYSSLYLSSTWRGMTCEAGDLGLCSIRGVESTVFPHPPQNVYISANTGNVELDRFMQGKCPEADTGRIVSAAGGGRRSDISICNVVGVGNDYVYVPKLETLFVLADPISFQALIIISVLVVVTVLVLSHNLQYSLDGSREPGGFWLSILCMLLLLAASTFPTLNADVLAPYISLEDRLGFQALVVYILYYTTRAVSDRLVNAWWSSQPQHGSAYSPVNPMLATLCVVTLRLHGTLDNTYTTVLCFLITARLLYKLHTLRNDTFASIDAVLDTCLITLLVFIGVVPQHSHNPTVVTLYIVQGVFSAQALARAMLHAGVHQPDGAKQ